MELVLVPAGSFVMGSPPGETGREPIEVAHEVRLSRAFYLGRHEVTQAQWHRLLGTRPSWFGDCGDGCPVERVSFHDAQRFVSRLSESSGERFRLPTEAEWEYACRAGGTTPFHTGENLTSEQANYDARGPYPGFPAGEFRGRPSPVGSFPPNAWGLHDMHGNVWEWCADFYSPTAYGAGAPRTDPAGPATGKTHVARGGCWSSDMLQCASPVRKGDLQVMPGYPAYGFRVVCELRR